MLLIPESLSLPWFLYPVYSKNSIVGIGYITSILTFIPSAGHSHLFSNLCFLCRNHTCRCLAKATVFAQCFAKAISITRFEPYYKSVVHLHKPIQRLEMFCRVEWSKRSLQVCPSLLNILGKGLVLLFSTRETSLNIKCWNGNSIHVEYYFSWRVPIN